MKKPLISALLVLCMALGLLPSTALAAAGQAAAATDPAATGSAPVKNPDVALYRVSASEMRGQPFRMSAGGDVIGNIPGDTILEVDSIESGWAKVKYKGNLYYMWADKLTKVSAPDVVCSPWAKEWLSASDGSYYGTAGQWTGAGADWTKPITRGEMAQLLVAIMQDIYGDWSVKYTLPAGTKQTDSGLYPEGVPPQYVFAVSRLIYWGVLPRGSFNSSASVTYGEFTANLIKLMAYDKNSVNEGGGWDLPKTSIQNFGIGGDTSANAKITMEQALILSTKTYLWWEGMENTSGAYYEQKKAASGSLSYGGTVYVGTGTYTIKTLIGTKPNQPHLIINAQGKGELSSTKTQNFKITYKKCVVDEYGYYMLLYTIQTTEGKYLALSGTPTNGSPLITRSTEYLWCLKQGSSEDYQFTQVIYSPDNIRQLVNASGWKTADGTPVLTWYWNAAKESIPHNCAFIFEYVN